MLVCRQNWEPGHTADSQHFLARTVTTWNNACDYRSTALINLMHFSGNSSTMRFCVGRRQELHISSLSGRKTFCMTLNERWVCCDVFGRSNCCPNFMSVSTSKKASHFIAEAEVVSSDAGVRMDRVPAFKSTGLRIGRVGTLLRSRRTRAKGHVLMCGCAHGSATKHQDFAHCDAALSQHMKKRQVGQDSSGSSFVFCRRSVWWCRVLHVLWFTFAHESLVSQAARHGLVHEGVCSGGLLDALPAEIGLTSEGGKNVSEFSSDLFSSAVSRSSQGSRSRVGPSCFSDHPDDYKRKV